jgi:cell division protein FtsI (penicillin-binding protein 3)
MKNKDTSFLPRRFWLVLALLAIVVCALVARMVFLTVFDRSFLLHQGNARSLRIVNIPAYRGMIADRNDEPLAISTLVDSIWINPQDFPNTKQNVEGLSRLLNIPSRKINKLIKRNAKREFAYLKRSVNPELAQSVQQLAIPGVYLKREYKRYYPEGEVASHVVGFTNIDDQGQEGLELAYNNWLRGSLGKQKVLKDRYGHIVAVLADISAAKAGRNLTLSIDSRIQYLAYQTLKMTVQKYHAKSGSVVVLNPKTGEILAMVNQPSFNPNKRPTHDYGQFRNRAVTDIFEPGSTAKAFSVASALDSGKYTPDTIIDTNPGRLKLGKNIVHDDKWENNGKLTVTKVLQKSSNIGVAKMTLSLPPEHLLDLLSRVGFGQRTGSGFPGESSGSLIYHDKWRPFVLATLAFGYGISMTSLQLAHAYGVIAYNGLKCPVTFLERGKPVKCTQAINSKTAQQMLAMLETVVQGGTGLQAKVKGYRVAGKTGTANVVGKYGYSKHRNVTSFVGIAPVSDPQLVVAVVVREPKYKFPYGGVVAAPAFATIMRGTLRILDIAPDDVNN